MTRYKLTNTLNGELRLRLRTGEFVVIPPQATVIVDEVAQVHPSVKVEEIVPYEGSKVKESIIRKRNRRK